MDSDSKGNEDMSDGDLKYSLAQTTDLFATEVSGAHSDH